MTEKELQLYLKAHYPQENEGCEWKEMHKLKNMFAGSEGEDIVSYVSAIANMDGGYLVIGVKDKTLDIVGIDLSGYAVDCNSAVFRLSEKCVNLSTEGLHIEEYIASDSQKRVWVIHIPKHRSRMPVLSHGKAWQRIKDSLVQITDERMQAILSEPMAGQDWSIGIVEGATIDHLDPRAIHKARVEFVKRNPKKESESALWDDMTFLNKSKLTINGKVTRTAMLLLGKEEFEYLLNPYVAKIRWSLRDSNNINIDSEIISIPFLINVDVVGKKIRNVKYRYLRDDSLFPEELQRYEPFTIREALNNAIAHQDYEYKARIEVVEYENERLVFRNHGSFIPSSIEDVVMKDCPESVYRNTFLVEAMRNLNMIDTEGGGIKKMFLNQKKRFFPMPEYDLSDNKVKVEIAGKVLDEKFANILIRNQTLSLSEIIMLDKVQKHKVLSDSEIDYLRKRKYIEGRKPNFFLSALVLGPTNDEDLKAEYIKNKSFEDDYFKKQILGYLKKYGKSKKRSIAILIKDKLSNVLTEEQKKSKIQNYLSSLRMAGKIEYKDGFWQIKVK